MEWAKKNVFGSKFYLKSFFKRKMNVMRQIKLIRFTLAKRANDATEFSKPTKQIRLPFKRLRLA